MTREPTLLYGEPSHVASAQVKIEHGQLRDLVTCPQDRGVVNYVAHKAIMEHDVTNQSVAPRRIAKLRFEANTIASYALPNTDEHLLAVGGQHGELYLALHAKQPHVPWRSPSSSSSTDARSTPSYRPRYTTRRVWGYEHVFAPTINNSVIFTPTYIAPAGGPSSSEPRLVISNNEKMVTFYDIAVRTSEGGTEMDDQRPIDRIQPCGSLALDVPVNHSSVSPDGQTLLSVGDSAQVHLHHISPGAHLSFTRAMTLTVPKPSDLAPALSIPPSSYPASFSTAFSASGSKFAVGAQNGVVAVWDVRSSKPLRTFRTDRPPPEYNEAGSRSGAASGWLRYSSEWEPQMAWPPGGVRCLKFGGGGEGQGREVMAFTEHTGRIHIVDATTFETEELIRMPVPRFPPALPNSNPRSRSASPPRNTFDFLHSTERDAASTHHAPLRYVHMRTWEPLLLRQNAQIPEFDSARIGYSPPFRPVSSGADDGESEDGAADPERDENNAPRGREEGEHLGAHDEILIPALENAIAEEDVRQFGALARLASRLSQPQPQGLRRLNLPRQPSPSASVGSSTLATEGDDDRSRWRKDKYEWDDDVDLAGVCFDASGSRMYVASTRAVAEWEVKGSEKRWWTAGTWA